jgi:LPPG:FO 2-phospho-L-lactate transferase
LGGPAWFALGDQDLGTHLERTRRIKSGQSISQVTHDFCLAWGVKQTVLPMSDEPVHTMVDTVEFGEMAFQEYFVHHKCDPVVQGFRFAGIENALPAPGVLEAIDSADAIIFCPSNPWVSIDPILSVQGIRQAIVTLPIIAVSPIIGDAALKGPAAKMFKELGIPPSAVAVARHYGDLLNVFILDKVDSRLLKEFSIPAYATNTIMKTRADRHQLAEDVLHLIRVK